MKQPCVFFYSITVKILYLLNYEKKQVVLMTCAKQLKLDAAQLCGLIHIRYYNLSSVIQSQVDSSHCRCKGTQDASSETTK